MSSPSASPTSPRAALGARHHLRLVGEGPERGAGGRAAVSQVEGGRWLTLEGEVRLATDAAAVDEGVRRYAARYRQPEPRPDRVVVEITVDRVLGRC